mmetsp:Transcript_34853/g.84295  ORF Transcript_34853/g.84295 Transcript_34853/m.84295 type:complete len:685 (+) Transcript_34853:769-2823(+)
MCGAVEVVGSACMSVSKAVKSRFELGKVGYCEGWKDITIPIRLRNLSCIPLAFRIRGTLPSELLIHQDSMREPKEGHSVRNVLATRPPNSSIGEPVQIRGDDNPGLLIKLVLCTKKLPVGRFEYIVVLENVNNPDDDYHRIVIAGEQTHYALSFTRLHTNFPLTPPQTPPDTPPVVGNERASNFNGTRASSESPVVSRPSFQRKNSLDSVDSPLNPRGFSLDATGFNKRHSMDSKQAPRRPPPSPRNVFTAAGRAQSARFKRALGSLRQYGSSDRIRVQKTGSKAMMEAVSRGRAGVTSRPGTPDSPTPKSRPPPRLLRSNSIKDRVGSSGSQQQRDLPSAGSTPVVRRLILPPLEISGTAAPAGVHAEEWFSMRNSSDQPIELKVKSSVLASLANILEMVVTLRTEHAPLTTLTLQPQSRSDIRVRLTFRKRTTWQEMKRIRKLTLRQSSSRRSQKKGSPFPRSISSPDLLGRETRQAGQRNVDKGSFVALVGEGFHQNEDLINKITSGSGRSPMLSGGNSHAGSSSSERSSVDTGGAEGSQGFSLLVGKVMLSQASDVEVIDVFGCVERTTVMGGSDISPLLLGTSFMGGPVSAEKEVMAPTHKGGNSSKMSAQNESFDAKKVKLKGSSSMLENEGNKDDMVSKGAIEAAIEDMISSSTEEMMSVDDALARVKAAILARKKR